MNEPLKLTVNANPNDTVTALIYLSEKKNRVGATLILGHGAGADQLSGFMRLFAGGLSNRGLDVMTFNFVYTEQRRGVPDQKAKLESCYRAVIEAALSNRKVEGNRLVIGGKSMGGRIASQVAATACEQQDPMAKEIAGLVFLGYPLHPPGQPTKLRTEHLAQIKMPMLFVQGTRDSLGSIDEIAPIIKQLKLPAEIYVIEGGDHSFKAPKKFGRPQEEVFEAAMDAIAEWVRKQK